MDANKITSKGQVTIPQKLRKMLGARPGDKIVFEASDDAINHGWKNRASD